MYHLLSINNDTDQSGENEAEYFCVNDYDEIKDLVDSTLENRTVFEVDTTLTNQIRQYFDNLGIDYISFLFKSYFCFKTPLDQSKLYFISDQNQPLQTEINYRLFFGNYNQTKSFENFLNTY